MGGDQGGHHALRLESTTCWCRPLTDRSWMARFPTWVNSPDPPYQCTATPRPRDARHTRSAKTHVAGRAPEHVRQEAGPSERRSHEFGPISNRRARRLLYARRRRSQSPPLPRATHTRGDPRRTPQPPPGTRLGPSHHQVKRPNAARPPASRARLPPSMAPSNAPGIARRPSSPPRRARAP